MTEREAYLLSIAREILDLNKDRSLNLMLTGSLMLAVREIKKPREAHDIDFLIIEECVANEQDDWCPLMPSGFLMDYEGDRSSPDCIKFFRKEDDLSVDFIPSFESIELVDNIPCSSVDYCIEAKIKYSENDIGIESRTKHTNDVEFIISQLNNNINEKN